MNTKIKTDERIKRLVLAIGKESLPRGECVAGGVRNYFKFARFYI